MAIASAQQQGNTVVAFDKKGRRIFARTNYELVGYTGTTISVRSGRTVYTFDEKGRQLSARS